MQDLFQEIIIQIWKAFPKFRSESKQSTWMYRIALNTAISNLRKRQRSPHITVPDLALILSAEHFDHEKDEKRQLLYEAISRLSELEKAIVMLYLEEKSYEEMEEILGIGQGNLRVKMNRIKEKLRKDIHPQFQPAVSPGKKLVTAEKNKDIS